MTGTSFIPAMIVAIIVVRTKKIINTFKQAGATTPRNAKTTGELGIRGHMIFRKLVRREVLKEASPERYYLNEENLEIYLRDRRLRVFIVLAIILGLIIIDVLFLHYIS
jgi:hypothetical protein